ncbi:hypothetical protein GE107_15765 [Cohnella sp. CFH 77786]|nr:hypothetical protein [Cohnella sp. CFH 77786]
MLRKLMREQQGSTIVLVGFAFTLMLAAAGLVVDGGTVYVAKMQLQKTANAAALSGAQELTGEQSKVEAVVDDILDRHHELSSKTKTEIQMNSTVRVFLKKEVPLSFSGLLGYKSVSVKVQAAAQIQPMGSAQGAAPLGIDRSIVLHVNTPYRLRVDSGSSDTGYFGVLALGGNGASTYEDNLKYGYKDIISVNDQIYTQTGNITGATRDGVKLRIDSDPYPLWDYTQPGTLPNRDSPRILLIPVYEPVGTSSQLKQIRVTGFAYFYVLAPMSQTDTEIYGVFFNYADTGFVKPGADNRGAYAIKLIA